MAEKKRKFGPPKGASPQEREQFWQNYVDQRLMEGGIIPVSHEPLPPSGRRRGLAIFRMVDHFAGTTMIEGECLVQVDSQGFVSIDRRPTCAWSEHSREVSGLSKRSDSKTRRKVICIPGTTIQIFDEDGNADQIAELMSTQNMTGREAYAATLEPLVRARQRSREL